MLTSRWLTRAMAFTLWVVFQQYDTKPVASQEAPSQEVYKLIKFGPQFESTYNSKVIGFINSSTFVTARTTFDNGSSINFWNIRSTQIISTILPSEPVFSWSVIISQDSRLLIGFQDVASYLAKPVYDPHKLFIWNLHTQKLIKTIDLGKQIHIDGAVFLPNKSNILLLTVADATDANDRLTFLNLSTGKLGKSVAFALARELHHDNMLFSPDGKTLVGILRADEGTYGGFFFFNAFTGTSLYKYEGDFNEHTIEEPYFFLSNTQLVCNRFIYNVKTKHTAPLFHPHETRLSCVSGVPDRLGYAFFFSKQGLELWNLPANKMVQRWSQVKQATHIYFPPDKSVMGVYNDKDQTLQVWKFNPKWVGLH